MNKLEEAAEDLAVMLASATQSVLAASVTAFEAGAKWQREQDIKICKDIELRGYIDGVPQPGAMSVRILIEEQSLQGK